MESILANMSGRKTTEFHGETERYKALRPPWLVWKFLTEFHGEHATQNSVLLRVLRGEISFFVITHIMSFSLSSLSAGKN
jgi:hypothetical protein